MVKLKQNIEGYLFIENLVRGWSYRKPLPSWLFGYIPTVSKTEELHGFHEVRE
jgi:hypothetical protein